jgi:hypothetical protein
MVSYKPEVIADASGKWCGNALRFATKKEAEQNVQDLEFRWFAVKQTRVVECDDPVTHTYHDRKLGHVTPAQPVATPPDVARLWPAGNPEDPE